jgi:polar amino acid transport system substrate-binding protein
MDSVLTGARHRASGWHVGVLTWVCFAACASAQSISVAASRELAPLGTLRVGLNLGNAVTVTKDATTGELRGVAVEMSRALASRLGVVFAPMIYPSAAMMVEAVKAGEWDVAFLAVDPARAVDMAFTQPYMEVDNTYLVPPGSDIQSIANVDKAGIRIAVPQGSAPDLFLSRTLQRAELVRSTAGLAATVELVRTGQAHALAADRDSLLGVAATWPGARVLEGRFLTVGHAIAIPKDRDAGLSFLRDFVDQAKQSGLIQQAIDQNGLRGVRVAP